MDGVMELIGKSYNMEHVCSFTLLQSESWVGKG